MDNDGPPQYILENALFHARKLSIIHYPLSIIHYLLKKTNYFI
jgi:hypothetical protein